MRSIVRSGGNVTSMLGMGNTEDVMVAGASLFGFLSSQTAKSSGLPIDALVDDAIEKANLVLTDPYVKLVADVVVNADAATDSLTIPNLEAPGVAIAVTATLSRLLHGLSPWRQI